MDIFDLMNEDFLKDKDVEFKTLFGQPCVEIRDKDKTFRWLSNMIDVDKLKAMIDKRNKQSNKDSHYPNQEILEEDKSETKEEFEQRIYGTDKQKTTPKSFEEVMYDKEPTKTRVYVSSYGLGGVSGNGFRYFKDTVKSFFDTKFGITNIEIVSGEYFTPLKTRKISGLIDILNKIDSADYVVLNTLSELEKYICDELKISYMMIPYKLPN